MTTVSDRDVQALARTGNRLGKLSDQHLRRIVDLGRALMEPPPRMAVSEWCEQNLIIPAPQTQAPGPLSFAGREYLREPLDSWNVPGVTDMVLCTGSQVGKTTLLAAGVCWVVCCDPAGVLWVMPNEILARTFSETRWQPIVRASPVTVGLIPSGAHRHAFKKLQQVLGGSVVTFVGSNSPANLASRPARVVILDEVDKFPKDPRQEADAVNLVEQRTKTFMNPRRVKCSTPTMSDGLIWQEFVKGDQRRYFIPCPHCNKDVVLGWSPEFSVLPKTGAEAWIRWDLESRREDGSYDYDRVVRSSRAECPHCQGHIKDEQKTRMLRGGHWTAAISGLRGFRSWHLSSLYVPGPQTSFGNLALQFLREKNSLLGLQGFVNGCLAEPWENQDSRSERVEIISTAGSLPDALPMMAVDVQAVSPYFWVVVRCFDLKGNSQLLGAFHCDDWEVIRMIQLAFKIPDNGVIVDSGHGTAEVYRQCLRWGTPVQMGPGTLLWRGWLPSKGRERQSQWVDKKTGRPKPFILARAALPDSSNPISLGLLEFNSEFLLEILSRLRKGPEAAAGIRWERVSLPVALPTRIPGCVSVDEQGYHRHIDSKAFKPVASGKLGKVIWVWKKRNDHLPDHLLDCEVMLLALALLLRRLPWAVPAGQSLGMRLIPVEENATTETPHETKTE